MQTAAEAAAAETAAVGERATCNFGGYRVPRNRPWLPQMHIDFTAVLCILWVIACVWRSPRKRIYWEQVTEVGLSFTTLHHT